jgi:thiol-disulfide isomerase/thioredoxin
VVAVATVAVGFGVVVAVNPEAKSAAAAPAVVAHPEGPAPQFHLASVTSKGSVDLGVARGRPVVLSFFASWCGSCRQELGTMASLARAAGSRVAVIGIDVNDNSAAARKLLATDRVSYPIGADGNDAVASSYRLVGLPTTVFLDAGHQVVGRVVGPLTTPVGRAWLAALQRPAA